MESISIEEVKRASQKGDRHWFDKDTMSFFHSRVSHDAYKVRDRAWFVSSERQEEDAAHPRLYSVRVCHLETGRIETVGTFQGHKTIDQAESAAIRAAAAYENGTEKGD